MTSTVEMIMPGIRKAAAWAMAALAVKLCGSKELIEVPQVQQKFSWFLVS
jgi:hypothetical protein